VAHREHRKLHAPAAEEAIAGVEQGIGPLAPKTREGRLDFALEVFRRRPPSTLQY
jgi:hypothetical protein